MKESGKPVLYGGYMIACSMLGILGLSFPKEFHLIADAFIALALFCFIGTIRGLAKNRKA